MQGTICQTNLSGGFVKPDTGGRGIPFKWCDCVGFGPNDIGWGVAVSFYIQVVNNRDTAVAVRRAENQ